MKKVILITGAAKRIGREIAWAFFKKEWNIIIHFNTSKADANYLASEMNEIRANSASIIQANLEQTKEVEFLAKQALEKYKRLAALINNASTFYPTPIEKFSENDSEALMGSNLKAPLFLIQALYEELRKNNGFVINVTDININQTLKNHSIYLAAKSGLNTITRALAKDLAPYIRVNAIAPGAILEPPNAQWTDDEKSKIIDTIPLGKMGTEDDIAKAAIFLAESSYVTGQTLNIDGGKSL